RPVRAQVVQGPAAGSTPESSGPAQPQEHAVGARTRARPESPGAVALLVVQDGPSRLLSRAAGSLQEEARALFGRDTPIRIAMGDHTLRGLGALIASALSDAHARPRAVIALGPLATAAIVQRPNLSTPTVSMLGAPLSAHGVGRRDPRPLLARGTGLTFEGDLHRLHELAPEHRRVAVPVTPEIARALPGLARFLTERAATTGLSLSPFVLPGAPTTAEARPGGEHAVDLLADLGADAMYLGLPLDPQAGSTSALLMAAARHQIPVLAGLSAADVPRGALLSTLWPRQHRLWARAAALALQSLLEGTPATDLRAVERDHEGPGTERQQPPSHRLVLNRHAVAALGLTPTFALLRDAEQGATAVAAEPISLHQAVARALTENQTLRAGRQQLEAADAQVRRARAPLLPQATVEATVNWIDEDRGAGPFPPAERTATIRGRFSQTLYSARKFGDFGVADERQQARERDYEASELDLVGEVAGRYIELMRALDLERVMYKGVENARINLTLSEARHRAGDVGREELYRWRIALSEAQQGLVRAQSRLRQAEVDLNEIQNLSPDTHLQPDEDKGSGLRMLATDARLDRYLERPDRLQRLTDFVVAQARQAAPELQAAQAEVRVAQRAHDRAVRASFLPELSLEAGVAGRVWNDGAGTNARTRPDLRVPNDLDWSVGLLASFPLFAGMADHAAIAETRAELKRKEALAAALALAIERRVHNAIAEASAAHQALTLATEAAEHAQQGMDLVRQAYARGAVDVLRLVDAQTQVVVTQLSAENAYHDYLAAFVRVEHALGRFSFGPAALDPDQFLSALARHPAPRATMEPHHAPPNRATP
ncbi:MAG: TolC family protein, partial [Myxococcales bacterium]|nr:TolC family protein [Myxococcales bacterium]